MFIEKITKRTLTKWTTTKITLLAIILAARSFTKKEKYSYLRVSLKFKLTVDQRIKVKSISNTSDKRWYVKKIISIRKMK